MRYTEEQMKADVKKFKASKEYKKASPIQKICMGGSFQLKEFLSRHPKDKKDNA